MIIKVKKSELGILGIFGILGNSLVSAAPATTGAPADAESLVSLAFRIDLRKPTHHVGRQRGLSTSPSFRCQEPSDQIISKYMNDIIYNR